MARRYTYKYNPKKDKRSLARKSVDGIEAGANLYTVCILIAFLVLGGMIGVSFIIGFFKYVFTHPQGLLAFFVVGIPCGIYIIGAIYGFVKGELFNPTQKIIDVYREGNYDCEHEDD